MVVKAGESVTCTFTNGPRGVLGGAPPPESVHLQPSFDAAALNIKPRSDTTPSSQPTAGPTTAPGTPATDGGASPSPSGLFGKALPATSGESSARGFSPIWLLLVLGILALFFLLFFLWRRKKERKQETST